MGSAACLQAELDFFDQVTEVSGQLYPVPKDQRKGAAVDFLRKLAVPRSDLYIPTNPECRLLALIPESGTPMQSAAKVRTGRHNRIGNWLRNTSGTPLVAVLPDEHTYHRRSGAGV